MTDTRPIRVALYARVSTSNHGQDVTLQTRELKEFIENRGWQFDGEYVDVHPTTKDWMFETSLRLEAPCYGLVRYRIG
jgi:Resolvase, N terminal domain